MKKSNIVKVEIRTHQTDIIDTFRVYVTYKSGATRTYHEITKSVLDFITGNLNTVVFKENSTTSSKVTTIFYADEINSNDVMYGICELITNTRSTFNDSTCKRSIIIKGVNHSINEFLTVAPNTYMINSYIVNVVYDNKSNNAFPCTFKTIQNAYNAKNELLEKWGA